VLVIERKPLRFLSLSSVLKAVSPHLSLTIAENKLTFDDEKSLKTYRITGSGMDHPEKVKLRNRNI